MYSSEQCPVLAQHNLNKVLVLLRFHTGRDRSVSVGFFSKKPWFRSVSLMLKILSFTIVYNVVFTLA